jgi:hypothetical protein
MESKNYLLINTVNNICENVVLWDGDTSKWKPPQNYLALIQSEVPSKDWEWDKISSSWVLVEVMGEGQIGYTWDGTVLTTNLPHPDKPPTQPEPEGDVQEF